MAKNSVLEQALLEAKQLEEAVKSNAKEILASTMKQEIEELVKESLQEDVEDLEINDEEEVDDLEDLDMEDVEDMLDMDDEVGEPDSEDEMVSIGMMDDFEDTLDLTGASDDEVMKVFKAMGSDDGVIVTQDDNTINIEDQEAGTEYRVEMNETDEEMGETMDDDIDVMEMDDMEMEEMDDETIYEIEMDEDQPYGGNKGDESKSKKDYSETAKYGGNKGDESRSKRDYSERAKYGGNKGDESRSRKDYKEASRTLGFGRRGSNGYAPKGQSYKPVTNNRNLRESVATLNKRLKKQELVLESLKNENQNYKNKNKDYKKALTMFRDKINEVAVFNANLAYSTKLFTEHTTSKQEKINVLRRFDNVETLNESKGLYKQLNSELSVKTKSITESIQKTISKSPKKGSSTNLIESKTYVNPQIARMKDIMAKL